MQRLYVAIRLDLSKALGVNPRHIKLISLEQTQFADALVDHDLASYRSSFLPPKRNSPMPSPTMTLSSYRSFFIPHLAKILTLLRGVLDVTKLQFLVKNAFSWKPKKLTKRIVRIGDVSLVQNFTKHPQRASEVSEENSCKI